MIPTTKESDEVLYTKESITTLTAMDLDELKKMAKLSPRKRIRICSHSHKNDKVHEMIIYHPKGTYVRPHKHIGKDESFHLISGEIDCIVFDSQGSVIKVFSMGDYLSGKAFYYRIPANTYHTQIFKKDTFFHEVAEGPFISEESIVANWSPDEKETDIVKNYMSQISIKY